MSGRHLPADVEAAWTAEIEWRGGTDEARFCAVARRAGVHGATVVADSAQVAWPPAGPTEVQALTDAHRELTAALATAGWKALPPGTAWYAKRFAWEPVASVSLAQVPAPADPSQAAAAAPWKPPEPPLERPGEAALFAPAPAWPDDSKEHWRCEIRWDAGWIDSHFQAVAYRPRRRRGHAIGASAPVRSRLMAQPEPERPEHREAVHELASALERVGWERVGKGADWYSERFSWRREDAPAARLEPQIADTSRSLSDLVSKTGRSARIRPK
jgi:hypothetical protein